MDLGVTDLLGLDGDYVNRKMLLIPEANFRPTDLRRRITADRRFDLAISMEVAEHCPIIAPRRSFAIWSHSATWFFLRHPPYPGAWSTSTGNGRSYGHAVPVVRLVPCDVFRRQFR